MILSLRLMDLNLLCLGSTEEIWTSQWVASRLGRAADRNGVFLGGTLLEEPRKTTLEELRKTKLQKRRKGQGRGCTGEGVGGGDQELSKQQGIWSRLGRVLQEQVLTQKEYPCAPGNLWGGVKGCSPSIVGQVKCVLTLFKKYNSGPMTYSV